MPKPTPEQVLKALEEDSEADDAVDRLGATTPQQLGKELEAAGYDVAEVNAKADARYDQMARASPQAPITTPRSEPRTRSLRPKTRRTPVVTWLAAAAVAVVAGGVVVTAVTRPPAPLPAHPATASDQAAAADLRRRAYAACEAQQWAACRAQLDDAKRLDPNGDGAAEVQRARQKAARGSGDGTQLPSPRQEAQ